MNPQLRQLVDTIDFLIQQGVSLSPDLWRTVPRYVGGLSPRNAWMLVCLARHRIRQPGWPRPSFRSSGPILLQWLPVEFSGIVMFRRAAWCRVPENGSISSTAADVASHTDSQEKGFMSISSMKLRIGLTGTSTYGICSHSRARQLPKNGCSALHSSAEAVILSFSELLDLGLLERLPERGCIRLASDCLAIEDRLDALERLWDTTAGRMAVAAALGDWLFVTEQIAPEDPEAAEVQQRADQVRDIENRCLEAAYFGEHSDVAIRAMAGLTHPKLDEYLERAISGRPSDTVSAALEIIVKLPGLRWHKPVYQLLDRVNPNCDIPGPHIWIVSAGYLLRHGYRSADILKRLTTLQHREVAEAAILALEFMSDAAVGLFGRALRSKIPCERITAAAALAIIDEPWSRSELAAVLRESDEQGPTAECRAALVVSRSADMQRLVREWESCNPHEPETGRWITLEEMALRTYDRHLQWEMQKLHDRVLPLRGRVAVKPPGKWKWLLRWFRSR